MIKVIETTWRPLSTRYGTLVVRPKIASLFGCVGTAIVALVVLSSYHRHQVDEARSAQVILNQIAVCTRDINTLTWKVLQAQNLSRESDIEMQAARKAL